MRQLMTRPLLILLMVGVIAGCMKKPETQIGDGQGFYQSSGSTPTICVIDHEIYDKYEVDLTSSHHRVYFLVSRGF